MGSGFRLDDSLPEGFALDDNPAGLPEGFQLDEDKYGSGVVNPLKAAALGAARGLTFSGSDYLLTKTGLVKPETIKGLEEQNPVSSMGGEIAGTVAGLAIPLGPAALAARAGKGVAAGVEGLGLAGRAAEAIGAGSKAAKVLGAAESVGSHAAGSAIEGALYSGVSNSIHESALGDPSLNGEKILENFGHGALLGGVLGGAVKGLELGIPPAVTAAKEGALALRNTLIGAGEGQGAGLVGKVLPEKLSSALNKRALEVGPKDQIELVNKITDQFNELQKDLIETRRINMFEKNTEHQQWLEDSIANLDAAAGTIHIQRGEDLYLSAALRIPEPVLAIVAHVSHGKGMAGAAQLSKAPVQTCNLQDDKSGNIRPGAKAVGAQAAIAIPLLSKAGDVMAVVGFAWQKEGDPAEWVAQAPFPDKLAELTARLQAA